jgi:hypothetical protein
VIDGLVFIEINGIKTFILRELISKFEVILTLLEKIQSFYIDILLRFVIHARGQAYYGFFQLYCLFGLAF